MQNQVIPNGSKVYTEYGVFEVLDCCIATAKYFCYKKYFTGHSGEAYFGYKYVDTKYEDSCWWFNENEVSLIEKSEVSDTKQPKPNYREKKPTDVVKVCIGDNKFEVPVGDLVHATALLAVTKQKQKDELSNLILAKQEELSKLIDTLNQM